MLGKPWRSPLGELAPIVNEVRWQFLEHRPPCRDSIPFDAQLLAPFYQVIQYLPGHGYIHRGVDPAARFGRIRRNEAVPAGLVQNEEVLVERDNLLEERDGTAGQEFPVSGIAVVIVKPMRQPACTGRPELAREILPVQVQAVAARAGAGEHAPAPVIHPRVLPPIRHERLDQAIIALQTLDHMAAQAGAHGGLQVRIEREVARPRRGPGSGPDSLEVRRQIAGCTDEHIATRVIHLLEQRRRETPLPHGCVEELLGALLPVSPAAHVEPHAAENLAVRLRVGAEEHHVIYGQPRQALLDTLRPACLSFAERLYPHQQQDLIGPFDPYGPAVEPGGSAARDDPHGRVVSPFPLRVDIVTGEPLGPGTDRYVHQLGTVHR